MKILKLKLIARIPNIQAQRAWLYGMAVMLFISVIGPLYSAVNGSPGICDMKQVRRWGKLSVADKPIKTIETIARPVDGDCPADSEPLFEWVTKFYCHNGEKQKPRPGDFTARKLCFRERVLVFPATTRTTPLDGVAFLQEENQGVTCTAGYYIDNLACEQKKVQWVPKIEAVRTYHKKGYKSPPKPVETTSPVCPDGYFMENGKCVRYGEGTTNPPIFHTE